MENLTLGSFVNLEDFQLKTNMALFSCVIVLICKQICQQDASRQELILFFSGIPIFKLVTENQHIK